MNKLSEKSYNRIIWVLSVIIPIVVAILFTVKIPGVERMGFLPPIYASINALTAVVLIIALVAVKSKKFKLHENLMKFAITLSVLFLIMYVIYHMTSTSTAFEGEGVIKYVYYFILVSHILLSIIIIPLVLFTYVKAITKKLEQHKKLARITFPIWLYVAITGVIVYLMISPYYV